MSHTPVLKAIQERRSVFRFKPDEVSENQVDAILEGARWAPSFLNSQPWNIVVVRDKEIKQKLRELAVTITSVGIEEAAVVFVVTVDAEKDRHHYVEDGAAATQNMALVAHSLGLGSFWVGVFDVSGDRLSSEEKIKEILKIPRQHRVISLLPVGVPSAVFSKDRKPRAEFAYHDTFSTR